MAANPRKRGRPAKSAKAGRKTEQNNKFFHRVLKEATAPNKTEKPERRKVLKQRAAELIAREEDLKAGNGLAKDQKDASEYEVERILHSRRKGGKMEFLVLWKGYRLQESTWEPHTNLSGSKELLEEYYEANPTRPGGLEASRRGRPQASATPQKQKTPKKAATPHSAPKSSTRQAARISTPPLQPGEETDGDEAIGAVDELTGEDDIDITASNQ